MQPEQQTPHGLALRCGDIAGERADDPGVHAELVLELTRRPARIADIGAKDVFAAVDERLGGQASGLAQYGDSYRAYMEKVPRYFWFF